MSALEIWRLLPLNRLPADEQIGWAEAMLVNAGAPALCWRRTWPEALILGHGQSEATVDFEACREQGIHVYRRRTGGAAVLSGPDLLSLDLVLPPGHPLAVPDVTRSYEWLGGALAEGLRGLDIVAAAASPEIARARSRSVPRDDPLRLSCYAMLSPYEVLVTERKLIGLAQARRQTGSLLQAGILLRWNPERLARLLALPPGSREGLAAALRGRAVGLDEIAVGVDDRQVIDRLTESIAVAAGARLEAGDWSSDEQASFHDARSLVAPLNSLESGG